MINLTTPDNQIFITLSRSDAHDLIAKLNAMLQKDETMNAGMPNIIPALDTLAVRHEGKVALAVLKLERQAN